MTPQAKHMREWRERVAREQRLADRAARRPSLHNDPAVKLYRREKKRAIRRGAYVLTLTRPSVDTDLLDAAERHRQKARDYDRAHAERKAASCREHARKERDKLAALRSLSLSHPSHD